MNYRVALAAVLAIFPMYAQEFRGAITGVVTDPTGLVIAGAKVTVVEAATNVRVEAQSDSAGQYAASFLLPGNYDVTVKMQGFKEFVRKSIHVGAGEHPTIDVRLEVGETSQSVEVVAD